ncbi:MAG: arginase family protein [Desulfatirhabdiaceae bacterium]
MTEMLKKQIVFLGCPLDSDEKFDAIDEKRNGAWTTGICDDPLNEVLSFIRQEVQLDLWQTAGTVEIPPWLGSKPCDEERSNITTENMVAFIDENGCKRIASDVARFVSTQILPDIPCLIGIDHSLTGGAYQAVAEFYGRDNVSLIVIDSHTDAVPMSTLSDAIQYDVANNPHSVHDPKDPFLYNRTDSYNASSFIHHMVAEKIVHPKNLFLLGVSDFPEKKSFRIKDPRISRFVNVYADLKRAGAKLVTKQECLLMPQKLKTLLKQVSTPYIYVSIDMDIGAMNALEGVRFRNWKGLGEAQIYKLIDPLKTLLSQKTQLAGMDIMEIDPRRAGALLPSGSDRTYRIAANLIKKIAFGL